MPKACRYFSLGDRSHGFDLFILFLICLTRDRIFLCLLCLVMLHPGFHSLGLKLLFMNFQTHLLLSFQARSHQLEFQLLILYFLPLLLSFAS